MPYLRIALILLASVAAADAAMHVFPEGDGGISPLKSFVFLFFFTLEVLVSLLCENAVVAQGLLHGPQFFFALLLL